MVAGAAAALLVAVEPGMGIAGMVEHAVEDHAHPRPLGVVAQRSSAASPPNCGSTRR
jgi:hypothetical protein